MELFRIQRDIPFMKYALVFNAISFLTFAVAVFFLVTRGLYLSIEFTGGTVMEVEYAQPANPEAVRHVIEPMQFGEFQVQKFGSSRDLMM
ncbi:MAG: protein translocase subunit SecF, partial [Inhella sp.]